MNPAPCIPIERGTVHAVTTGNAVRVFAGISRESYFVWYRGEQCWWFHL